MKRKPRYDSIRLQNSTNYRARCRCVRSVKAQFIFGGLLASLPLISFLAIIWLYFDTKDVGKVAYLSTNIFWLVLPSLAFFAALPTLLRMKFNFALSFVLATLLMLACYGAMLVVLKKLGVNQ